MSNCEYCGTLLKPGDAFCPKCGAPVKGADISESVKDFERQLIEAGGTDKIEYTRRNSFEDAPVPGKIAWIFLWIFLWPVLLFVYIIRKFNFGTRNLSPVDSKRANIVSNYTFTNDRKTLLEALIFIETQIDILAEQKRDGYTNFWINLWTSKAEQVYSKAKLSVGEDVTVGEIFNRIKSRSQGLVKKTKLIGAAMFICTAMLVAIVAFVVITPYVYTYNIVNDTGAVPLTIRGVKNSNVIKAENVSVAGILGTCFETGGEDAHLEFKDDYKYLDVTMSVICTKSLSDEIDSRMSDKIEDFDNEDFLSGAFALNGAVYNYISDYGLGDIQGKEMFTKMLHAQPGDEFEIHLINEVKSYDRAEDYKKVMEVSNLILTIELTYVTDNSEDNFAYEKIN